MKRKAIFTSVLSVVSIALAASVLVAGPLTPPVGPVAPTAKPLAELEPRIAINATNTPGTATASFRISGSGSYYLTGNIVGEAGKHGIQIATNGVTLDLCGFEVRGAGGSLDGINISTSRGVNIVVKNGSIRNWGDCGLECEFNAGNPPACTLERLEATNNGRNGFAVRNQAAITDCKADQNTGTGMEAVGDTVFTRCVSTFNTIHGFNTNSGCVLTDCIALGNTQRGIYTGLGSTVRGCVASSNGTGFVAQSTILESCSAYTNTGNGFDLFTGCTVKNCNAYRSGGIGIDASSNAVVADCTASENDGIGINAGSGTLVSGCTVNSNLGTGIQATSNCTIRGNSVVNNGGSTATFANIRLIGSDARVEGNNCTDAPIGVLVDLAGNVIERNTCSGNTVNWQVAAGNVCFVLIAAPTAAAISGDSGGVSPGSTNPSANYTY